ncbi:MAG: hypothetical protein DSZ09_01040 [Sulfurovum sp.]|nr:MAG: hypothetical protein DSZ09_01040 [Sulfurovum sp.]
MSEDKGKMILSKLKQLEIHRYTNYIIMAYAFILPLSRAGISFFTALLILIWLLEGNFKYKLHVLKTNKVIWALGIFLLFNLLSVFWTDDRAETLHYIHKYWYFLPIVVLCTSLKKEQISKALSAFILGMFVSEIIAYGVFFELWQFKHATPENPSPFMHHIEYSVFLAFTALVLLSRIFNEKQMKYKGIYLLFFSTISGNLFLTEGRTGQLAFIIGLFILTIVSFTNKTKAIVVAMTLSFILLIIAFNFSHTFHDRMFMTQESIAHIVEEKDYCSSLGGRVGACIVAKDIIINHPIIGEGITDNMKRFHHLIDTKYPEMECMQENFMHMHNQYLQIFTELGLIGLLIFLNIFYRVARIKIKNREYEQIKYIYVSVLLFAFLSEVIFHRQFSMALFAFIVGLLLAQNRVENEI